MKKVLSITKWLVSHNLQMWRQSIDDLRGDIGDIRQIVRDYLFQKSSTITPRKGTCGHKVQLKMLLLSWEFDWNALLFKFIYWSDRLVLLVMIRIYWQSWVLIKWHDKRPSSRSLAAFDQKILEDPLEILAPVEDPLQLGQRVGNTARSAFLFATPCDPLSLEVGTSPDEHG